MYIRVDSHILSPSSDQQYTTQNRSYAESDFTALMTRSTSVHVVLLKRWRTIEILQNAL